jgi:hypothetical protein
MTVYVIGATTQSTSHALSVVKSTTVMIITRPTPAYVMAAETPSAERSPMSCGLLSRTLWAHGPARIPRSPGSRSC